MQCSVIEWARHLARLERAHSAEFDPETPNPVIHLLPEQQDVVDLGGTMRLGLYPCRLQPDTLAFKLYQKEVVYERHRHRYEFNNAYRTLFLESGYTISGTSPDGRLVEIIELPNHPFFVATQFHPEFQSRPNHPHPPPTRRAPRAPAIWRRPRGDTRAAGAGGSPSTHRRAHRSCSR